MIFILSGLDKKVFKIKNIFVSNKKAIAKA